MKNSTILFVYKKTIFDINQKCILKENKIWNVACASLLSYYLFGYIAIFYSVCITDFKKISELFGVSNSDGKFYDLINWEIGSDDKKLDPEGYSNFIPMNRAIDSNLWDAMCSVSNTIMNEMFICLKYSKKLKKKAVLLPN